MAILKKILPRESSFVDAMMIVYGIDVHKDIDDDSLLKTLDDTNFSLPCTAFFLAKEFHHFDSVFIEPKMAESDPYTNVTEIKSRIAIFCMNNPIISTKYFT